MSMRSLETAILAVAKVAFRNPKLRLKDIREWSTGEVKPQDGEVVIFIPDLGVYVAILTKDDRRAQAPRDEGKG